MMRKIILIVMIVLFPLQSYALEFDIWRTGETKNKVQKKAKQNKIALKENAKIFRDDGSVMSNEIHYIDSIFQEEAEVSLVFTQQSNLLYGIIIDWRDVATAEKGEALYEKIAGTLGKKYIQDGEVRGKGMIRNNQETFKDCTTSTTTYKGAISSTIFRCQDKRFMSVRYIDSKLEKQNAFEEKNIVPRRNGDGEKF